MEGGPGLCLSVPEPPPHPILFSHLPPEQPRERGPPGPGRRLREEENCLIEHLVSALPMRQESGPVLDEDDEGPGARGRPQGWPESISRQQGG